MTKIKIKESNKGKFTAWAKNHGLTVQQAANKILSNKEKYSPTLIKRAQFARNASKWDEGGEFGLGGTFLSALGAGASLIPGVGTAISTGLGMVSGLVGGAEDAKAEGRLAMNRLTQQTRDAQVAGNASVINPYAASFKVGGQFRGKRYPTKANNYTALFKNDEVILNPNGRVEMSTGGLKDGSDSIPVNPADGTKIIANGKQFAKDVKKYNKAEEMLSDGVSNITKNSLTLNKNKYYSKFLNAYNEQEAKKLNKTNKKKFYEGGGYTNKDNFYTGNMFKDKYNVDFNLNGINPGKDSWYDGSLLNGARQPFAAGQTVGVGMPSDLSMKYTAPEDRMIMPQIQDSLVGNPSSNMKFSNPLDDPNSPSFNPQASREQTFAEAGKGKFDPAVLGEIAPMLYNFGMGLFGKREKLNPRDFRNPYENQINSLMANRRYRIDAPLLGNEAAYATARRNITNLGGPDARGSIIGAQNAKMFGDMALYDQQNNMNNAYVGDQANMMYGLGRDAAATNLTVSDMNSLNNAAGRNMIGAGMSGLQQYLLTRRQMKNQEKQSKILGNALYNYSPYARKWVGSPELEEYMK